MGVVKLARSNRTLGAVFVASAAGLLSACGGGSSAPRPTSPASVPPPPPPPPPTSNFDTQEYRDSNAATFIGAINAYESGATGVGVKIAVLDSGVDVNSAEFAGRIDGASRDIAGNRGIEDQDGHGTSVSAVALAARNGLGIEGIAFSSTLIALRTDAPGTCASTDGCSHYDDDLAVAMNAAVAAGARVVNISLGGSAASAELTNAIANATSAGVIVVIAAGNDSDANPDPLARVANQPNVAHGRVLIAGSVDSAGVISDFSNHAGSWSDVYIATLGERVRSFDNSGTPFLYSGTSYATPGVVGAVALLASAFPNLSADEIIQILFDSARDAGSAGIDAVYGRGILDLASAFAPQGGTSLAGSAVPVAGGFGSMAVVGGALGDGGQLGQSLGGVILLDGYHRAFGVDLAGRIGRAAPRPRLGAALAMAGPEIGEGFRGGGYSVSLAPLTARPWLGLAQRGTDAQAGVDRRATRGLVAGRPGRHAEIGFAAGYGADSLLARMDGEGSGDAFITGGDSLRDDGMDVLGTVSAAGAYRLGKWKFGLAIGDGAAAPLVSNLRPQTSDVAQMAATLSRRFGALGLRLTYQRLDEARTVLGATGSPALGLGGAISDFLGIDARYALGGGWTLGAAAKGGRTRLDLAPGGLAAGAGDLVSVAFSAELAKDGVFGGDRLALRVAQPLRVERGALALDVPVSYDYRTLSVGYARRETSLAPSGREIDVEAAWSKPLPFGWLGANLYWRQDPGHIAALNDDVGAALRLSLAF